MTIRIVETVAALRDWRAAQRAAGKKIALVPTMGALHHGHLELMRQGLARADRVIASIFVNPTQFGPTEDFAAYPRTWDADLQKLTALGVAAVYHPSPAVMYPQGFATTVAVAGVTEPLEGPIRPGHFAGVATVVTKLLLQVQPDIALFGEKDFQQLAVIRRLAADLDIPVEIVGVPIVRDASGLALSSRNAYLNPAQYVVATRLNEVLFALADRAAGGENFAVIEADGQTKLRDAGFDGVDYLSFRDAFTLEPATRETQTVRLLAVARIGAVRLLDNMAVDVKVKL